MSTRETVIAATVAALKAAGVASGRVYRSRQEALATLPAVSVEPLSESADETALGMLDRTLALGVTVHDDGTQAANAIDATLALIESTLLADRSLGLGVDVQIASRVETRWDFDFSDITRATAIYSISMRTAL